jgi:hypothetical protein
MDERPLAPFAARVVVGFDVFHWMAEDGIVGADNGSNAREV